MLGNARRFVQRLLHLLQFFRMIRVHADAGIVGPDRGVLLIHDLGDRVAQAEGHQQQPHARPDAEDGHEEALLIAEQVAEGRLLRKAHPLPQEGHALQQHALALRGRRRTHQLRGRGAKFRIARRIGRQHRAQHRNRHRRRRKPPLDGRDQHGHIDIEDVVGRLDDIGQHAAAEQDAQHAAQHRGRERIADVFGRDRALRIAQRLHRADLQALLLHHARHGRQRHQRRHQEEDRREHLPDCADAVGVHAVFDVGLNALAVKDVPFRHGKVGKLFLRVGHFLLRLVDVRLGADALFVKLRLRVVKFLLRVLVFLSPVGKLLLRVLELPLVFADLLLRVADLLLTVDQLLLVFGDLRRARIVFLLRAFELPPPAGQLAFRGI